MDIREICSLQKEYFNSGATRKVQCRLAALTKLKKAVIAHKDDIEQALYSDLGKSPFEGYMTEIGLVLSEISYMIKHLPALTRRRRVKTPLALMPAECYSVAEPYGTVLIMGSWNYPLNLALIPLVDALAAGNTAIVKVSSYAPATAGVVRDIITDCLPPEYVSVIEGSREVNNALLEQEFDYIFFTGSKSVGKVVLQKAAQYMTPVTLELGGKSPCIVDKTADIAIAARRIVFGKFLNAGQTCVAPDYVLADAQIQDALLEALAAEIKRQYGEDPLENIDYCKIVNDKHFQRLTGLYKKEKVYYGGKTDKESLRIEPTIILEPKMYSPIMKEEIFGPLLPVLSYDTLEEAIDIVQMNPDPLALYLFTTDDVVKVEVFSSLRFGGGCINDTIMHMAGHKLGFGGIGQSGMGAYHGKTGFDTFSHHKSVVDKFNIYDNQVRYQPYNEKNMDLLKKFFK